jgi:CubicO group peptidase (beta-lactamase class C family)
LEQILTRTTSLPRSTPEAQGIPSQAIEVFITQANDSIQHLHSFILVRHGHVVAEGWWEPYAPQYPHMLFSLSKSFTSTGIGLLVAEGRLSVDDFVLKFFPDDAPADVSDNLAAMRVRHLLSMSTGHDADTLGPLRESHDDNWARDFLAQPVTHAPGTHFVYNSGATYMLSAIVQHVTGMRLLDYLRPRLLQSLGIEGATWETCPRGINVGGWGLSIKTEDIARFGQLYLQKGVWDGRRILPETWVNEATSKQVSNENKDDPSAPIDWQQGYGYQFWRCRHNTYRGDGAFGQFCVVMSEQDAVLAITAGVPNMQAVLDLVWAHLLPAMQPTHLPACDAAHGHLNYMLAHLSIPVPKGQPSSPLAAQTSGRTYVMDANQHHVESVTFEFGASGCTLVVRDCYGEHRVACGDRTWLKSMSTFSRDDNRGPFPIAASGAWASEDTFVLKVVFYETPFCITLTGHFADDALTLQQQVNVSFGPTEPVQFKGHLQQ